MRPEVVGGAGLGGFTLELLSFQKDTDKLQFLAALF